MTAGSLITIGTSAGGLHALTVVLSGLRPPFDVPVVVVQHRSPSSHDLANVLQDSTPLVVEEAEDKVILEDGHVYIAPADYHVLVGPGELSLTIDEPVRFSRPSIDVCFESAAESYGAGLIGVILTGANQDGCRGARRIAEAGGQVIVQDPKTAESPTMPLAAAKSVKDAVVLPLEEIADALMSMTTLPVPHVRGGGK
jgi:two-component system chemotaxis response regulator CheB